FPYDCPDPRVGGVVSTKKSGARECGNISSPWRDVSYSVARNGAVGWCAQFSPGAEFGAHRRAFPDAGRKTFLTRDIAPMQPMQVISLTPDFSRVFRATDTLKPFERFSVVGKAVETADDSLGRLSTWLKPGVNESRTFLRS